MHATEIPSAKLNYISPKLVCVKLDNEISLALQSSPPPGEGEGYNNGPEYLNNDPFKMA